MPCTSRRDLAVQYIRPVVLDNEMGALTSFAKYRQFAFNAFTIHSHLRPFVW